MAAITTPEQGRSKRRTVPHIHLDMTPMVDLGFLLITFFMLTTHLLDERVMELSLPLPGPATAASNTLTILLDEEGGAMATRVSSPRQRPCTTWVAVHCATP